MISFVLSTPSEIERTLGERIRTHRLAQGVGQKELALRAGVSELTVRHLERRGGVSLLSFIKIVVALGLADEFLALLEFKVTSIKDMEQANQSRQRAPRRST